MAFRASLLVVVALCPFGGVDAQEVARNDTLEEIVVTAQSRSQSLQDVPISANVVGAEFLTANNLDRLQDVAQRLPSLTIVESATGDQIFLRGVGSAVNPGFEQSVATFVDGVYKGRDAQSRERFLDVDRIEVLRGPQSIFFGHNTIAGAISIVTKGPGDEFSGYGQVVYGPTNDDYTIAAAAGGPMSEKFGARLAFRAAGRDGFLFNQTQNRFEDKQDSLAGRLTLAWRPTERVETQVKLEYSKFDQIGSPKEAVGCPAPAPFPSNGATCNNTLTLVANGTITFDSRIDGISQRGAVPLPGDVPVDPSATNALIDFVSLETYTAALTMKFDVLGGHSLTSLTAFTGYTMDRGTDIDNLPIAGAGINDPSNFDQFSQEIRLISPTGQPLEYVLGIYYQQAGFFSDEIFVFPRRIFSAGRDIQSNTLFDQSENAVSAFGAATWNISDDFRISGGVRFTRVEKSLFFTQSLSRIADGNPRLAAPRPELDGLAGFGKFNQPRTRYDRSDQDFMPSVDVQYDFNDDVTGYAKFSQGFKAGGFDQRADRGATLADLSFDSEQVDAYEVGIKAQLFDRRLVVNLGAFRSDYSNLQVSSLSTSGVSFVVDNAASARSQGIEADLRLALARGLTLSGAVSYLDAKFTSFPDGPCNAVEEIALNLGGRPGCGAPLPAGQLARIADRTGDPLPFAPKWSGSATLDFTTPIAGDVALDASVTSYFATKVFHRIDNDPRLTQGDYIKFDARIGLTKGEAWQASVLVRNVTDRITTNLANRLVGAASTYYVQQERGRHVLLQLGYKW